MMNDTVGGYFRIKEEEHFPWDATDKKVWYAIFVVDGGKISREGYTPAKTNKISLADRLEALISEKTEHVLIGVWTGTYSTHLFVLDSKIAIKKLRKATK